LILIFNWNEKGQLKKNFNRPLVWEKGRII